MNDLYYRKQPKKKRRLKPVTKVYPDLNEFAKLEKEYKIE